MQIVKLGGSLFAAPALRTWLAALADARTGPWIVVPGGGPFADAIRELQPRLGLEDHTAHRMAILAMQQYALYLHQLEPRLPLLEDAAEMAALGDRAGLWLPWRLTGRDASIEASWDLTSDSLALLLARRLGAEELLLVKSGALPGPPATAASLAASGLLDAAFPRLAAGYHGRIRVAHRDDAGACEAIGRPGAHDRGLLLDPSAGSTLPEFEPA